MYQCPSGDWALILVNPTHYLPDDFEVTLADFEGGQVDERILEVCEEMFADAEEDGVTFQLVDAYRSYRIRRVRNTRRRSTAISPKATAVKMPR